MEPSWERDSDVPIDQGLLAQSSRIPTPIGGVSSSIDYAPSCLFVALYAVLIPVAIYRLCRKSSRNLILIFTLGLLGERYVSSTASPPLHS